MNEITEYYLKYTANVCTLYMGVNKFVVEEKVIHAYA